MKKILFSAAIGFALVGCGGAANDGDPATDTSHMPADPAITSPGMSDSGSMMNSNTGSYPTDTAGAMKTNDTRSSSSAYPDGRGAKAQDSLR